MRNNHHTLTKILMGNILDNLQLNDDTIILIPIGLKPEAYKLFQKIPIQETIQLLNSNTFKKEMAKASISYGFYQLCSTQIHIYAAKNRTEKFNPQQ